METGVRPGPRNAAAAIDERTAPRLAGAIAVAWEGEAEPGGEPEPATYAETRDSRTARGVAAVVGVLAVATALAIATRATESGERAAHPGRTRGWFRGAPALAAPTSGPADGRTPGRGEKDMRSLVTAAAALAIGAAAQAQVGEPVQWRVEDGGNGHWYVIRPVDYPAGWSAFLKSIAMRGAHVATLRDPLERAWVSSTIVTDPPGDGVLVGAYLDSVGSAEQAWRWTDGTPVQGDVWCINAPSGPAATERWIYMNDQAHAYPGAPAGCFDDMPWNTWARLNVPAALIEWSADCNGDGIVDYGQCRAGTLPDYDGNNIPDCCEAGTPCVVGNYAVQWRVADGGNGHWYARSTVKSTWDAAKAATQSVGGHLATIRDSSENEFVRSISAHVQWIGGRRAAGTCGSGCGWQWDNGEPWSFTNWRLGEPNGGVLEQTLDFYSDGTWNDDNGLTLAYIIEWSADCDSNGIVDFGEIRAGQLPDENANNVPDGCECAAYPELDACCPGDLYRNGVVNGADLGILLAEWGAITPTTTSDLNRDGTVDGGDLGILLSGWGPCPG